MASRLIDRSPPYRLATMSATGGWGAKLSPGRLSEVLTALPRDRSDALVVGMEHPDDAAVVRSPGGDLSVQTVDLIAPIVNDQVSAFTDALADWPLGCAVIGRVVQPAGHDVVVH